MSIHNVKPSVMYPVSDQIVPQSIAAAGSASSGWVDASVNKWAVVQALVGAGAGTLGIKIEQATTVGGAGVKDLATAAQLGITALDTATKHAQADFDIPDNIDVDNAYRWIRVTATVTGGAGTLVSVSLGLGPAPFQS